MVTMPTLRDLALAADEIDALVAVFDAKEASTQERHLLRSWAGAAQVLRMTSTTPQRRRQPGL